AVPQASRESDGGGPPHGGADPDLLRAIPDDPVLGRAPGRPLRPLDPRSVEDGPVLRAPALHARVDAGPADADADRRRPPAGAGDADHAGGLHVHVPAVSDGPRSLLARQQPALDRPAIPDR